MWVDAQHVLTSRLTDLGSCSDDSPGEEGPVILDVLLGHRERPDRRHGGPLVSVWQTLAKCPCQSLPVCQVWSMVSLVTLHHNPLVSSETLLLSSDPAMIHLGEF